MPLIPVEGAKRKTRPWPERTAFLEGAMAKMKEVEKGRTEEVVGCFVRTVVLYRARPVEYDVWLVKVRTLDSIVAFPKRERREGEEGESSKPLKRKSTAEIGFRRGVRRRVRRKRGAFMAEEGRSYA